METILYTTAAALFTAAGLTPTPEQEQQNRREACDWAWAILAQEATEADFTEATQARIIDILAERETAKA